MNKRVADYIFGELARQQVTHVFMLSGGGIMYLTDALGRSALGYVPCHHEQSAAIAAQAYAQQRNCLGVCLVTTGPGGTNALTGCAAAYVDSTPMLFLSGQVKRADFASLRGVRQYGAQENDIISMAAPVTKYAVLVEEPRDAVYHVQKAIWLAQHGRRGPVWVDVPLDVQSAELEESELRRFDPETEGACASAAGEHAFLDVQAGAALTAKLLREARRPLFLLGHGLTAAGAADSCRELLRRLGVPVEATWRALGLFEFDDPLFFGSPGLQAVRSSNIIVQSADLLVVLGSRLDNMITAFAEARFGCRARKVVVDIDPAELAKLKMPDLAPVLGNVADFVRLLAAQCPAGPLSVQPWREFCLELRERFPLLAEQQTGGPSPYADLYRLTDSISAQCRTDDVLVVSSTSRCNTAGHMAFRQKKGQMPISSMGMGSMGFALPSAVGAAFAAGLHRRLIVLEGDGSFQLNIQELQTIRQHGINAKIFVFCNGGYAAIATMQDRNFSGFHVASDAGSGVTMPDLERIAQAYGYPFVRIANNAEIESGVAAALGTPGPVLCEVVGDILFDEIPKCISSVNEQGVRVSAALENPFPFLPDAEMEDIFAHLPA